MAVLPRDFVLKRLAELPLDEAAFWQEASVPAEQVEATLAKEKEKTASVKAALVGDGRAEIEVTHADGKAYVHRVIGPAAQALVARLAG
jgi:hypothetical protein